MCLNPALAIHSGDKPPPLYICSDCADELRKEHSEYITDILLPMSHVSTVCENKVKFLFAQIPELTSDCIICTLIWHLESLGNFFHK